MKTSIIQHTEASDTDPESIKKVPKKLHKAASQYFKVDDLIDYIDTDHGAWFEGKLLNILTENEDLVEEENLIFEIVLQKYSTYLFNLHILLTKLNFKC